MISTASNYVRQSRKQARVPWTTLYGRGTAGTGDAVISRDRKSIYVVAADGSLRKVEAKQSHA